MRSTIYEVDEDVFQITTEHDSGECTVELVFGQAAYEAHKQREMKSNGQRDEYTTLAGYFAESDAQRRARRVAGQSRGDCVLH